MKGRPSTNPHIGRQALSFVRIPSRAMRWREIKPANPTRREIKNREKLARAMHQQGLRESHDRMTLDGIERRLNGGKLGHRRRVQMLNELFASF